MEGSSSNTPQHQAMRRTSRNRNTTPLVASFKQQLDITPQSDIDDLSKQLHIALAGISDGPSAGDVVPGQINVQAPGGFPASPLLGGGLGGAGGGMTRMKKSSGNSQAASSAGRMLLGRPNFPAAQERLSNLDEDEKKKSNMSKGFTSTGQLNRRASSKARRDSQTFGSMAASMTAKIADWDGYYKPVSSSRRNSRAGSELSMSMKANALAALAELGEVSDDEDDDEWLAMPVLKEESLAGSLRGSLKETILSS